MAQSSPYDFDIYQPRNPKASAYYKCVENHFEELEQIWDDVYKSRYGYWRTYVMTVIYSILGLPGCVVKNVVMSICWHFHVSVDIFAHPVIRKGLSNMVNGCLPMF